MDEEQCATKRGHVKGFGTFRRGEGSIPGRTGPWVLYFDGIREQRTFRFEAEDFTNRLEGVVRLPAGARVLDFGCGFGFVARALAPLTAEIDLWDASPGMRARAAAAVAGFSNARVLEVFPETGSRNRYDLIIVNSVIQYMGRQELLEWLRLWQRALTSEGRIVIADVVPARRQAHRDLIDQVWFGARRGFLLTALREGVSELRRYAVMRQARPLTRFTPGELETLACHAHLAVEFLPRNLTCRTARISLMLTHPVSALP